MVHVVLLQDLTLPHNITATTSMAEAIAGARFAIHALPVQHSRAFLTAIKVVPGFLPASLSGHYCSLLPFAFSPTVEQNYASNST